METREQLEDRLSKIQELKMRLGVQRGQPVSRCGPEPCREVCAVGYKDQPGYPSMIAQKGNPHYKHGEIHDQCPACWLRQKNETAIRQLKCELGYKS